MAGTGWFNVGLDVGNLLGGLGGMFGATASTKKQYKYQSALQAQQQAWMERMSNTAHQREVADLREAGLNPLLSVMGGNGASTPQSGMGQINAPDYGAALEGIATAQQIKMNKVQAKNIEADTGVKNEAIKTEAVKRANFEADTGLKNLQAVNQQIQNSQLPTRFKKEMELLTAQTYMNYAGASAQQVNARANIISAKANDKMTESNKDRNIVETQQQREYNEWGKKHPVLKSIDQTATRYLEKWNTGSIKKDNSTKEHRRRR